VDEAISVINHAIELAPTNFVFPLECGIRLLWRVSMYSAGNMRALLRFAEKHPRMEQAAEERGWRR
jgi:hypothetical protein